MASHREILKANRRARRKRYFRRSMTVGFLILLILLFGSWYFWNSSFFSLTNIAVTGTETISVERLVQAVNNVLGEKYLNLFSRRVNWFYPRMKLLAELHRQFPGLLEINVTNFLWGTLRVEISERQPVALWCDGDCYYLDSTGLVYSPAPQFSNNPFLLLTDIALPTPLGSRPLAISDFQHLLEARSALNQLLQTAPEFAGQTIDAVSLAEPVDYAFNVRNVRLAPTGWRLLTARQDSIETIVSRLVAAFSTPSFLTEYRLSSTTLDYLDIRFDHKVFYKFMP